MKNYKGGYKIIDLENIALLSGGKVDGIYARIEASYRKPILLSGIVISDVEKNDVMTKPEVVGTSFVFRDIYGYDVTIEDDDTISVASTQWATRAYVDEKVGIKTINSLLGKKLFEALDLKGFNAFESATKGGFPYTGYLIAYQTISVGELKTYVSGLVICMGGPNSDKVYSISKQEIDEEDTFNDLTLTELAKVE